MPTFTAACVGMHFRGAAAVQTAAALEEGTIVTLEREPENPHDYNALKVFVGDFFIGYVDRMVAAWISPLLDEQPPDEARTTARVVGHEQRGKNLHPLLEIVVDE